MLCPKVKSEYGNGRRRSRKKLNRRLKHPAVWKPQQLHPSTRKISSMKTGQEADDSLKKMEFNRKMNDQIVNAGRKQKRLWM